MILILSRQQHNDFCIALNRAQYDEMRKYKWLESEKAGYDLGNTCCIAWIRNNAERYRKDFIKIYFGLDNYVDVEEIVVNDDNTR